jgi:hypothetical protein
MTVSVLRAGFEAVFLVKYTRPDIKIIALLIIIIMGLAAISLPLGHLVTLGTEDQPFARPLPTHRTIQTE